MIFELRGKASWEKESPGEYLELTKTQKVRGELEIDYSEAAPSTLKRKHYVDPCQHLDIGSRALWGYIEKSKHSISRKPVSDWWEEANIPHGTMNVKEFKTKLRKGLNELEDEGFLELVCRGMSFSRLAIREVHPKPKKRRTS